MSKILLGLCVLLPAPASWAISNIENERSNLPDEGLSSSLRIGLNGKTENKEERSNEGGAKLSIVRAMEFLWRWPKKNTVQHSRLKLRIRIFTWPLDAFIG